MPDTYLRSSRILIGRHDYFAEEESSTVKVNGIEMTIQEFRLMSSGKKRMTVDRAKWNRQKKTPDE